jgi:hypothetical protein
VCVCVWGGGGKGFRHGFEDGLDGYSHLSSETSDLVVVREAIKYLEVNINAVEALELGDDAGVLGHLAKGLGGPGDDLSVLIGVHLVVSNPGEEVEEIFDAYDE